MEQEPTTSLAKEKQPVIPLKKSYLDDVFSIFKASQHPFVLVEESVMRWMGLRVFPEEVNYHYIPGCLPLLNSDELRNSIY